MLNVLDLDIENNLITEVSVIDCIHSHIVRQVVFRQSSSKFGLMNKDTCIKHIYLATLPATTFLSRHMTLRLGKPKRELDVSQLRRILSGELCHCFAVPCFVPDKRSSLGILCDRRCAYGTYSSEIYK